MGCQCIFFHQLNLVAQKAGKKTTPASCQRCGHEATHLATLLQSVHTHAHRVLQQAFFPPSLSLLSILRVSLPASLSLPPSFSLSLSLSLSLSFSLSLSLSLRAATVAWLGWLVGRSVGWHFPAWSACGGKGGGRGSVRVARCRQGGVSKL